ncbi:hypothetical protein Hanom_Chr16g01458651 [Helianthus anomalus]
MSHIEFGILKATEKLTRRGIAVETLKKALDDNDAEAGGAGPSHQVLQMNDDYDRLLCFIDPAAHLVMTSLGGLQCLSLLLRQHFLHVCLNCYEVIVDRLLCLHRPDCALGCDEPWRSTMFVLS